VSDDATKADPAPWEIRDPVERLRVFGDSTTFPLAGARIVLGRADSDIILDDTSGRLSRRHAAIERTTDGWTINDLASTNGIRQDGELRASFALTPGVEIELGGVKLVAESQRSIALHAYLQRLLGYAALPEVDRALRAVREMATLRAALVLRGEGSLVGCVQRLHALVLGAQHPLSIHDGKEPGAAARDRAIDGLLYLHDDVLPRDINQLIASLRAPTARVRLVIGAKSVDGAAELATLLPFVARISTPRLSDRAAELDRLLAAYADDAVAQLGAPSAALREHDLRWVRDGGIDSHEEAEEVMRRVVALRNWGVTAGAERLGITHGALSKWLARRKIPS
jgi:hypothetical protein